MRYTSERELVPVLQSDMEECIKKSCQLIETEIQDNAYKIWEQLQNVIYGLLERVEMLQKQNKKGDMQYLVFSFLRYGVVMDKLEIRIDALDNIFYLDMQECAEYYAPMFLQERYAEDISLLYENASKRFIRLQNYEFVKVKEKYAEFYKVIISEMLKSLIELIVEMVVDSNVNISNQFKILYGEYMDKATVLYTKEKERNEVFSNRNK